MAAPLARTLVDMLDSVRWDRVPADVRDTVQRCATQILGVARLGAGVQPAAGALRFITGYEKGSSATLVGAGRTVTAPGAAFGNTVAAHTDFREDTHATSQSHPGVVVIPAALAAAEAIGDGTRFAEAVVVGYEATCRLGEAAAVHSTGRGFRAPAVYPAFGAAIAVARVLGLNAEQTTHAIAITAQGAGGLNQPFLDGTDDWFLAPAFAARHGLTAAFLAAEGIAGSPRILDGEDGLFAAFSGSADRTVDLAPPWESGKWRIAKTRLKSALTCGFNQSLVHLLRTGRITADGIDAIRVSLSPGAAHYPGVASQGPYPTRTTALLSAPYAVALLLTRGVAEPSGYEDLADKAILELAKIVTVTADPGLTGYATRIEIDRADGTTLTLEDGDDDPGFSHRSLAEVEAMLRNTYRAGGLDVGLVGRLRDGVESAVREGSLAELSSALGR